ncbi:tRNA 2-selenouridine(34) synthase MnmH [Heliobacterium gestii]|uniref:tRNA 2-selenouridine(34) synthase MnmH n=1 Tax=Heliomicrobium gestii TaxID=2699 RepID=A0A845LG73_HELGE|nr:tRNA 2-selenouridine(34) synthase MnmH [Heliomicrobium gestii]MBM7868405.1 rhodanese-related sulfurtransferase [Heliomicrobium gestii]MZP44541.1 tRNA 2-selenouridine(34) synthase MnmH [Heliomicrobium gestii]
MRGNTEIPITIEKALSGEFGPLIDVRSEGEYTEATIPGAVNLPLLSNEERVRVGTIYRHQGPADAREIGLEITGPKLPEMYRKAQTIAGKGPAVLFCWRGGMRSKTTSTVLNLMGMETYRLEGGYKAFRRYVNEYLEQRLSAWPFLMLHGNTGVGKTEILSALAARGAGVIDLEAIAENRGSVFGHIGYDAIPSQQTFGAVSSWPCGPVKASPASSWSVKAAVSAASPFRRPFSGVCRRASGSCCMRRWPCESSGLSMFMPANRTGGNCCKPWSGWNSASARPGSKN